MADTRRRNPRRIPALLALAALGATAVACDPPPPPPPAESGPDHVTADPLPTVQVNGVVWDQAIVGGTVYAVGEFTAARPAGAAPGVAEVPRANILAYDLRTGVLVGGFAPTLNAEGLTVTASPDGSRIYVGGMFTSVNGVARGRIAALDPVTGALVAGFTAATDYRVTSLVATGTAVYAGGSFHYAGPGLTASRDNLAAFSASSGALLGWAPRPDAAVDAMVLAPGGAKLVVGGRFRTVDGVAAHGTAALDGATGAVLPWPMNTRVRVGGEVASIVTLSTDGTSIYGGGFAFGYTDGNLEGVFAADAATGELTWVEDCHGDTHAAFPVNGYVYTGSHAHYCGNIGGFPESEPRGVNQRFALSFTTEATGAAKREPLGYPNWERTPSPSLVHWFPEFRGGTYTGQNQAVWTVTGNDEYVVMGGEFPSVNGVAQQGIVRFAVKPTAPGDSGPRVGGAGWPVTARSSAAGQVRITLPANFDRDDRELNYRITRDGVEVHTVRVGSAFWDRPVVGFTDTGATPGATHTYRVAARDDDGNVAHADPVTVTVATTGAPSPYADTVMADGARLHWRLDEPAGATSVRDEVGRDGAVAAAVTLGVPGALLGEASTAASLAAGSRVAGSTTAPAVDTLSVEAWVRTSSTQGGRIVGFTNAAPGTATTAYDRVLYLTADGRVVFGVRTPAGGPGPNQLGVRLAIESAPGLNDGQWHHVVGTLGPKGTRLFVDGAAVASRNDLTGGQQYYGHWQVGADILTGWPDRPPSDHLAGLVDEVAVYHLELTAEQVAAHVVASGRPAPVPPG